MSAEEEKLRQLRLRILLSKSPNRFEILKKIEEYRAVNIALAIKIAEFYKK